VGVRGRRRLDLVTTPNQPLYLTGPAILVSRRSTLLREASAGELYHWLTMGKLRMNRRSFQALLERSRQSIKEGKGLSEEAFWEAVRKRAQERKAAAAKNRRAEHRKNNS
jgi:hypothetical protein